MEAVGGHGEGGQAPAAGWGLRWAEPEWKPAVGEGIKL